MSKRRQIIAFKRRLAMALEKGILDYLKRTEKIPRSDEGIKRLTSEMERQWRLLTGRPTLELVEFDPARGICTFQLEPVVYSYTIKA
jgi:hypothetical protein